MPITPTEPLVFNVSSTLSRFSGFFYQCFLIPLMMGLILMTLAAGRQKAWQIILKLAAACMISTGLYCLCGSLFYKEFEQFSTISHFLMLAIIILYSVLLCPMQGHVKVVMVSAIAANINFAQSIATQLFMPEHSLSITNLIQFGILLLALVILWIFRPSPSKEGIPAAYWLSMLVIAVFSTACLFVIRHLSGKAGYVNWYSSLTTSVILCAFFVVNLLIYYLYFALVKEHQAGEAMRAMQAKYEQDLEFYKRSEALTTEYRSLRHELKNHISLMENLLREEKYEDLRKYFAEYAGKVTPLLTEFRCPNPLVTSVITHQMNNAFSVGVTLDVIAAIPETLGIDDDDLCSLLSNMFDNGVEGCLRAGQHIVKATLHTEKGSLFITVTNPADEEALRNNPALLSTKEHPDFHGFGIPIIRSIVEKYDGVVTFQVEDGWFTVDAMLYMKEEE